MVLQLGFCDLHLVNSALDFQSDAQSIPSTILLFPHSSCQAGTRGLTWCFAYKHLTSSPINN